jgi:hypothetical protein
MRVRNGMLGRVDLRGDDGEVLNPIVEAVTVDVMNEFIGKQGSPKMQFHEMSMERHLPTVHTAFPVPGAHLVIGFCRALAWHVDLLKGHGPTVGVALV